MKQCAASPSCSILVNGSPAGFIVSSRGLRQGDPLSLYLFTLIMKALSISLESEILNGNLHIPISNFGISHLMFVGDILIFYRGEASSLTSVEGVLTSFAACSASRSIRKKVLFFSKSCRNRSSIIQTFSYKEGLFPMRYQGFPWLIASSRTMTSQD